MPPKGVILRKAGKGAVLGKGKGKVDDTLEKNKSSSIFCKCLSSF
jgi:hypothetical protein